MEKAVGGINRADLSFRMHATDSAAATYIRKLPFRMIRAALLLEGQSRATHGVDFSEGGQSSPDLPAATAALGARASHAPEFASGGAVGLSGAIHPPGRHGLQSGGRRGRHRHRRRRIRRRHRCSPAPRI